MAHYNRGASAERELFQKLWNLGFAVVRAAGSGKMPLPSPDLIALGKGRKIAIECKYYRSKYLHISKQQFEDLLHWGELADSEVIIAWKIPRKGWFFLKPEQFRATAKNYAINKDYAMQNFMSLETLFGNQTLLE